MFDTSECIKEVVPRGSADDIQLAMDDAEAARRRRARLEARPPYLTDMSSSGTRIRSRPANFYSGLTAEVTAIEMADLSGVGSSVRNTAGGGHDSTKHTIVSNCNTPPVECSSRASLTDLTKAGQQPLTITAEAVRERVALNEATFDLKVDVHSKPLVVSARKRSSLDDEEAGFGGIGDHQVDMSSSSGAVRPDDVSIMVEGCPVVKKKGPKLAERQLSEENRNRRRFSNLSNLAQSLPSTSSSASALVPVAGSIDFLTQQYQSKESSSRRRRQSKEKRSSKSYRHSAASRIQSSSVSEGAANNSSRVGGVRKSAFENDAKIGTTRRKITRLADNDDDDCCDDDEDSDECCGGSQSSPLLIKRHQSLDENRSMNRSRTSRTSVSSCSLDRHLTGHARGLSAKRKKTTTSRRKSAKGDQVSLNPSGQPAVHQHPTEQESFGSDVDMATFQAELEEATEALLRASQCESSASFIITDI